MQGIEATRLENNDIEFTVTEESVKASDVVNYINDDFKVVLTDNAVQGVNDLFVKDDEAEFEEISGVISADEVEADDSIDSVKLEQEFENL